MPILCIDFGTSSIKAALLEDYYSAPRALLLGEAVSSSIDSLSIPSAVFVSSDCSSISFGETALKMGLKGVSSKLFETSPKKWMTDGDPDLLEAEAPELRGTGITRKQLLSGLLAHAFIVIATAAKLSKKKLLEFEIRVAHPVWKPNVRTRLNRHLREIAYVGGKFRAEPKTLFELDKFFLVASKSLSSFVESDTLDVEEPVAAALALFANGVNSREICVVVDVGAGTIDLGIFLSVTSDDSMSERRFFIPLAKPRSIYMAGDAIDVEVIALIENRAAGLSKTKLQDLKRRKRFIKELLFKEETIFEAGQEIKLGDLTRRARIKEIGEALKENFDGMLVEASSLISDKLETIEHPVERIDVIFAGGGGSIGFLQRAIGRNFTTEKGSKAPIIIKSVTSNEDRMASTERSAVALGGTRPKEQWPRTEMIAVGSADYLRIKSKVR